MEIFIDSGLFELLFAITLGYIFNFIFLNKYLLILFSVFAISAPMLAFFFHTGDFFYFLVSFSIVNSILLVFLLWKEYHRLPHKPLVDIEKFKQIFYANFSSIKRREKNEILIFLLPDNNKSVSHLGISLPGLAI